MLRGYNATVLSRLVRSREFPLSLPQFENELVIFATASRVRGLLTFCTFLESASAPPFIFLASIVPQVTSKLPYDARE